MSITILAPQLTPPVAGGRIRGLQCRECGQLYAAEARHACELCFGPLEVAYDYDMVRGMSEQICRYVLNQHPRELTMEWSVHRRRGKVADVSRILEMIDQAVRIHLCSNITA